MNKISGQIQPASSSAQRTRVGADFVPADDRADRRRGSRNDQVFLQRVSFVRPRQAELGRSDLSKSMKRSRAQRKTCGTTTPAGELQFALPEACALRRAGHSTVAFFPYRLLASFTEQVIGPTSSIVTTRVGYSVL